MIIANRFSVLIALMCSTIGLVLSCQGSGGHGDTIDSETAVTGVTLTRNATVILVNGTEKLSATVQPLTATNRDVTWSSDNSSIAKVSDGVVTGVATGNTKITVTTVDGGFSASCDVTVSSGTTKMTSCTQPSYLPDNSDGIPDNPQWIHGATLIVKDNSGSDLVGFFRGDNSLHAAVSADDGATWSWINPSSNIDIDPPLAITQDVNGTIHLIGWDYSYGARYARVTLVRDANKHITGFTRDGTNIAFTGVDPGDMGADIVAGVDSVGNPTLFCAIYENAVLTADVDGISTSFPGGKIVACKTTRAAGLCPASITDFVQLNGSAGMTEIASLGDPQDSNGWAAPHTSCVFMAQHPVSKDLWFQWGPANTYDGLAGSPSDISSFNWCPVQRMRATPDSDGTFTLGTVVTVATHATKTVNGYKLEAGTQNYAMTTTPDSVWFVYGSPSCAVNIDKAGADGTIVSNAIPSPYDGQCSGGFYELVVNTTETSAWMGGSVPMDSSDPDVAPLTMWAKYWDGTSWTTLPCSFDFSNNIDGNKIRQFRMAGCTGWNNGLVFVQTTNEKYEDANGNIYYTRRPLVCTIRTLP